jgi:hypothetical protein
MVGVGAVAGTLSGGNTDAVRSQDVDAVVAPRPAVAAAIAGMATSPAAATPGNTRASITTANVTTANVTTANVTTIAKTVPVVAQAREAAPVAVIAMRFPGEWQREAVRASTGDNDPPPSQTMAYAAEPSRPAAAASGFQLASVDHTAEPEPAPVSMPKRMVRPEKPKPQVLFNDAQLASIKARLKLSRDQEQYWPQVEQALRAISWKLATQKKGVVRGNQAAMIDPNSPEVARLKSAAFPLIMSMRSDQKEEVRQLAHTMGLKQVASMF